MNIGIALVLSLIVISVIWNLRRVASAYGDIRDQNQRYAEIEGTAAELGRVREQIRQMRSRYENASQKGMLPGDPHLGVEAWRVADEYIADSAHCLKRMDFVGALAQMSRAYSTANEYMRDFVPS